MLQCVQIKKTPTATRYTKANCKLYGGNTDEQRRQRERETEDQLLLL